MPLDQVKQVAELRQQIVSKELVHEGTMLLRMTRQIIITYQEMLFFKHLFFGSIVHFSLWTC